MCISINYWGKNLPHIIYKSKYTIPKKGSSFWNFMHMSGSFIQLWDISSKGKHALSYMLSIVSCYSVIPAPSKLSKQQAKANT